MALSPAEAAAWLARNAVDSLPEGALEKKLAAGRPLRVKLGIDPTAPDIHLGHTVVLQKLREFQDLGHEVVLVIGDYTARVGDPSGRSATRPALSGEEIDANARTFTEQAYTVLDPDRSTIRFNSEWLDMSMEDLFRLRADPHRRPTARARRLRQAVRRPRSDLGARAALPADAGLRLGRDSGRRRARRYRPEVQPAARARHPARLRRPRAGDPDDAAPARDRRRDRMAKSIGNYVGVSEPPDEIYGKTLSLPDEALDTWYELLLGVDPPPELGPRDAKRALARKLVARFHGDDAAEAAEREFDRVHIARQAPEEMPTVPWPADQPEVHLPALLERAFGITRSEARRSARPGRGQARRRDRRQRLARPARGRGRRQGPPVGQAPVRARARGQRRCRSRARPLVVRRAGGRGDP